jgi:hypothetical protein
MGNIVSNDELEILLKGKSFGLARPPKCGGTHADIILSTCLDSGPSIEGLDCHYHRNQAVGWGAYRILPDYLAKECVHNERIFIGLIRNPYDWLVSFYCYAISHPGNPTAQRRKKDFLFWLKGAWLQGIYSCPRLPGDDTDRNPGFVSTYKEHYNIIHWTLMKEKQTGLINEKTGLPCTIPGVMTFEPWPQIFIRSEYLNQGLNQFLNLKFTTNGRVQADGKSNITPGATTSMPYKQWYDEEAVEMVAEKYKEELELFGYDFNGINKMDGPIIRI